MMKLIIPVQKEPNRLLNIPTARGAAKTMGNKAKVVPRPFSNSFPPALLNRFGTKPVNDDEQIIWYNAQIAE